MTDVRVTQARGQVLIGPESSADTDVRVTQARGQVLIGPESSVNTDVRVTQVRGQVLIIWAEPATVFVGWGIRRTGI